MGAGVLSLDLLLTAFVVGYLVYNYGSVKKEFLVCLLVFFTWFICFSIVFILPLDVSSVSKPMDSSVRQNLCTELRNA